MLCDTMLWSVEKATLSARSKAKSKKGDFIVLLIGHIIQLYVGSSHSLTVIECRSEYINLKMFTYVQRFWSTNVNIWPRVSVSLCTQEAHYLIILTYMAGLKTTVLEYLRGQVLP